MIKLTIFSFVLIISFLAFVQEGLSQAASFRDTRHPGNIFLITVLCVFIMIFVRLIKNCIISNNIERDILFVN